MTQLQQPSSTNPRASNRRLGLILLTVALVFFIGIFAKKVIFG